MRGIRRRLVSCFGALLASRALPALAQKRPALAEVRMDYAAIGNVTNLAAQLCSQAKSGQVLAGRKTMAALDNAFQADELGALTLKGFEKPVPAFALRK